MNRWFSADSEEPALKSAADAAQVGISDLDALLGRVGQVITAVEADAVAVQEGPSRRAEMELFVQEGLGGGWEVYGPSGQGQQKLYVLVRDGGGIAAATFPPPPEQIVLGESWQVDVDGDRRIEPYEFTRAPLVLDLTSTQGGIVRLVNVHTKSKYVHAGQSLWENPDTKQDFVDLALKARRRISAEVMRVREYVDAMFARDPDSRIVVMGDLNDGPGTDYFERHYLTHNLVGMLAGSPFHPPRMLRHAFIDLEEEERNFTAIFDDFVDEIDDRKILLDHILVSPALYWMGQEAPVVTGRIEHEAYEAGIDEAASGRQRLPSDHRPQSVTLPV
jgi:endonuclease/exonuclease/phosphatase family metal-dependent hydrolase